MVAAPFSKESEMSLLSRAARLGLALLPLALFPACSQSPSGTDGGGPPPDAGGGMDSSNGSDSGTTDAGNPDAGPIDAGHPLLFDGGVVLFDGGPPLGTAIVADAGTWTWVDFPDSACNDGSTTGIGVNVGTTSNVLVYMEGGGACWNAFTCYTAMTATLGPFQAAQFATRQGQLGGSIFDRTVAANPFKDWNMVYMPYCTGDVHAGDNVANYGGQMFHHQGHDNVLAYLKRLGATFPTPAKVAITGSSAGGGGVMTNYPFFRAYWPGAQGYEIDDSLPFFVDNPAPSTPSWITSWNLTPLFDELCGANCQYDFSQAYSATRISFPNDRMALLSYVGDSVIPTYYQMNAATFAADLAQLQGQVLAPIGMNVFFIADTLPDGGSVRGHTMLGDPTVTQGGTDAWTFLNQMVTDDPNWTSVNP